MNKPLVIMLMTGLILTGGTPFVVLFAVLLVPAMLNKGGTK